MPRPSINLEPYRDEISTLYKSGKSPPTIAMILGDRYGIQVRERTIKTRLSIWGIQKVNRTASADTVLHARITVLLYQVGLSEDEIIYVLQHEGWNIQPRTLKHVRHQQGLLRRTVNPTADQAEVERVLNQLRADLATGQIEGNGVGMVYQHFKNQGFQIGSCYGYLKLASYGIEVYAAIDAYSRYILWIYIGISTRTAVSVLQQFLDTVGIAQQQPRFVRSDRDTDTILLAEAQYKLQQSLHPELDIRDCYLYGTSTSNQRIEALWHRITCGMVSRYREYFRDLQEEDKFYMDQLSDRIALYAIYIPLLRVQIPSFVRTWNHNSIQNPANRPHLVPGKPYMNYNFPATGVENQGVKFDMELFKRLQEDVQDWDIDEYLPPETYRWTRNQLLELGYDPQRPPDVVGDHILTPFRTIYLGLRDRIQAHIKKGSQPILQISQPPTGAFDWGPRLKPNHTEAVERVREVELVYELGEVEGLEN
ncbi:hypothetical protein BDW60DRAFT_221101 [Aspergillus nidulans var. acristatus]